MPAKAKHVSVKKEETLEVKDELKNEELVQTPKKARESRIQKR